MNVGHVERVRELSAGRIARMRDQIDFRETGSLHVPAIRLHWNVVLEPAIHETVSAAASLTLGQHAAMLTRSNVRCILLALHLA